jgi:PAS domain S-box-containing protein
MTQNGEKPTNGDRLLLVEDSPVQAREISLFLQGEGYVVDIAPTGEQGLEQLKRSHYDLLLCDLHLPGANGFDICRQVKAQASSAKLPVVLLTRWADPLNILRGMEAGADGFISKGQRRAEIVHRVRRVIERSRQAQHSDTGKTRVVFLDTEFELSARREQLLEVLLAGFEDTVYLNGKFEEEMTKRLAAQAAEREKDAQYRAIFESANDAIVTIDERGIIISANPTTEEVFGYTLPEVIGHSVSRLIPSPHREQHDDYIAQYVATGVGGDVIGIRREVTGQRKDGTLASLDLSVSAIVLDDRRLFTGILRDITSRKNAERMLEQYSQELKRSNAELEQYAYVVSHDLKEPLRMVTSFTNLLEEELRKGLSNDARRYMRFVSDGAGRMRTMIEDLLDYSRVGRGDMEMEATDLTEAVATALENLAISIQESGVEVQIGELPPVSGVPSLLLRLFQNLIGNAIKFRGDRKPVIQIGAEQDGETWKLFVRDNGIGIESQHLERVFQVFQRLHRRDEYEGSGIGLAVCRKIVERHGGQLWVESVKDEGSTFWLTFPVDESVLVGTAEEAMLI